MNYLENCKYSQLIKEQFQFDELMNALPKNDKNNNSTRFYIFRHGSCEGKVKRAGGSLDPWTSDSLTEEGKFKIEELAQELFKMHTFDAIYTAPAAGASESAKIIGKSFNLDVKEDDRLRQKHWGKFHGQLIDNNEEYKNSRRLGEAEMDKKETALEKITFRFDLEASQEETLLQVFERAQSLFTEINNTPELKGKNICIMTHTPVLKVFFEVLSLLNQNKDIVYHRHDFENGGMIVMDLSESNTPTLVDAKGVRFRAGTKY